MAIPAWRASAEDKEDNARVVSSLRVRYSVRVTVFSVGRGRSSRGQRGQRGKKTLTLRQRILARDAAREIAQVADGSTTAPTYSRPPTLPARFAVWGEPSEDEGWYEVPARRAAPRQMRTG